MPRGKQRLPQCHLSPNCGNLIAGIFTPLPYQKLYLENKAGDDSRSVVQGRYSVNPFTRHKYWWKENMRLAIRYTTSPIHPRGQSLRRGLRRALFVSCIILASHN